MAIYFVKHSRAVNLPDGRLWAAGGDYIECDKAALDPVTRMSVGMSCIRVEATKGGKQPIPMPELVVDPASLEESPKKKSSKPKPPATSPQNRQFHPGQVKGS